MTAYRTGSHHGVTIIEIDENEAPDSEGRRPSDRLMGMALTPKDADRIVFTLNELAGTE